MSRDARLEIEWAGSNGDKHTFRLTIGMVKALQEACDAGPRFIFDRLQSGKWLIQDVSETIRHGLIGGGMKRVEADRLVREYVEAGPYQEFVLTATLILAASLFGTEQEDMPGKTEPAEDVTELTPKADSPSPGSTEMGLQ